VGIIKILVEVYWQMDILVSATGKANLVKADWVKESAVVTDAGIEQDSETGELTGDVDFDEVLKKVSYLYYSCSWGGEDGSESAREYCEGGYYLNELRISPVRFLI
jgi:hypothetical protein